MLFRKSHNKDVIYELGIEDNQFDFTSSIESAMNHAKSELASLEETIKSVKNLSPDCDKTDYILAACSGALCGIFDIFLVGKPGQSPMCDVTDKWFDDRTISFAKFCGWNEKKHPTLSGAITYLEKKFKIPYDQCATTTAGIMNYDLNTRNHHFKSLAHNPTLFGLFFSIMDQFSNTSHFVFDGELISLQDADGAFYLNGNSVPAKLYCAFTNWVGHLISDRSGSSGSKGRGMGIPSPFWAWTNDIIVIRRKMKIPVSTFEQSLNKFAIQIYKEGFDSRFQAAQFLPVLLNEFLVRFVYSIRRLLWYYSSLRKRARAKEIDFPNAWIQCKPFSNPSIKRMLTVAHGTFCLIDLGDAAIRGIITGSGYFNIQEFFLRLNIAGVGRFAFSLYGEARRGLLIYNAKHEADFAAREKTIVEDYIIGLKVLSVKYDDKEMFSLINDFRNSNLYLEMFKTSYNLAEKRGVPEIERLKTKKDIDTYFQ